MKHPLRPLVIAGNWKMYKTIEEAALYFKVFEPLVRGSRLYVYLAVPFTAIKTMADLAKESAIVIGAQNMNDAEEGAITGEISARMLKEAGARFVILGHSERRRLFHERDDFINRKVKRALADGLQPILCAGETQSEREQGLTEEVLRRQIHEGLAGVDRMHAARLIVAYEPAWAIGSLQAATPEMTCEAHRICRAELNALFSDEAERIPILYGGSVKLDNAQALIAQPNVDGFLVGTASLSVESFAKIVHLAENRSFNPSSVST
ncbi:MAG: triose-phosphate isomerase [Parachlamydia sp.]|nr:triose-phosphate isomerase [Parachlamydia sp.]